MASMTTVSRWAGGVLLAASLLPWAAAASASTSAVPVSGDPRATAHSGNATTCAEAGLPGQLITFTSTNDGTYVTITATQSGFTPTGVVVKGADAYNVYLPADLGALPWTKLHAPLNSSGDPGGLSHFYVCGTSGETTTPATPCPTTTVTKTVTETAPGPTTTVTRTTTATATTTVTAPGETATVTVPGPTTTETVTHTATATQTVTTTVPGPTVTETVPGPTVTITLPGATITETAPGPTVTETTTAPGSTVTTTAPGPTTTQTVTVTASTGVLPTKIGQSTTPASVTTTSGTAVLGEKLPQTGPALSVGKALALSLILMIAGITLLALPGHIGLEINRKH